MRIPFVGFLMALAAFIALSLLLVLHGVLNADEGFYLAASHFVAQGFRPYHDFGYTQGPLWPYLELPWLKVFGFTLTGQRLAGLGWTLLMVGVGVDWLRRKSSWGTAACWLALLLGSPLWLAFAVKGKTYGCAGLAVLAGALAVTSESRLWIRWTLFIAAAAISIGSRMPTIGFFVPAGIGLLVMTPNWTGRLGASAAVLAALFASAEWAAAGNWDRMIFWTLQFHRESSFYIPIWTHFLDGFRFAPVVWVLAGWAAFGASKSGNRRRLILLGSLIIAAVLNLSASTTYAEYIFPFLPTLAFLGAPTAITILRRARRPFRAALILLTLASGWNYPPEFSPNVLQHAAEAEAFLRQSVPSGAVVAASMPEIAVAAGARLPTEFAMGKFGLTEEFSEAVATERRMLSPSSLRQFLANPGTRALVLSPSYNWSFYWSLPSYHPLTRTARSEILEAIHRYYALAFINAEYAIYLRRIDAVDRP